jgi:hypothetical protein
LVVVAAEEGQVLGSEIREEEKRRVESKDKATSVVVACSFTIF